jgi:hypothetical protein
MVLGLVCGSVWAQQNKRDWTASNTTDFYQAIAAINADAGGGDYTITLSSSFEGGGVIFTDNAVKTITLKGEGVAQIGRAHV